MPLGWYLAQGLYPLGPSSSDDEEGPCELPDGRLVCGPHGLVICYKCTVDYSFMDDVLAADKYDEDKEEEEDGGGQKDTSVKKAAGDNHVDDAISNPLDPFEKRRGNGSVIASKFTPPLGETNPMQVFKGQRTYANLTR